MKISGITFAVGTALLATVGAIATKAANNSALQTLFYYNEQGQISTTITATCPSGAFDCRIKKDATQFVAQLYKLNNKGVLVQPLKSDKEAPRAGH
ncbi:hypothetical protein KTO58_04680 [Chitinophaga pendula]|uniref:hypothetical protein n=1 Tax=Chitinophaga TaxID=79328 RepID=UPI000BAF07A9|nr:MULTISPECIES: hypothetical protein [Chitinophaga]ASZ13892.1 hypothetical protein CK934_24505 [Chitinophaga sp. MD30]UCJ08488.1 hypothetical protein KTO58_04680 [Chitinophaga pendula]